MKRTTLLAAIGAISFALGFSTTLLSAPNRFDYLVREDFFAGFGGNEEALKRAMTKTEATLADEPNHAEALVWHGAGLYYQAGQAFRSGDMATGQKLSQKGLEEMDRAVSLAPNKVGVRVPRGAVLMTSARFMPPEMAIPLLKRGVEDYKAVLELQKDVFADLGTHPQGELLQGLGDGYSRLGQQEDAALYYSRIVKELPNTPYAKRANTWMETKSPLPVSQAGCIGCHNKK